MPAEQNSASIQKNKESGECSFFTCHSLSLCLSSPRSLFPCYDTECIWAYDAKCSGIPSQRVIGLPSSIHGATRLLWCATNLRQTE